MPSQSHMGLITNYWWKESVGWELEIHWILWFGVIADLVEEEEVNWRVQEEPLGNLTKLQI